MISVTCKICGEFYDYRTNKKYCSGTCRDKYAYEKKKGREEGYNIRVKTEINGVEVPVESINYSGEIVRPKYEVEEKDVPSFIMNFYVIQKGMFVVLVEDMGKIEEQLNKNREELIIKINYNMGKRKSEVILRECEIVEVKKTKTRVHFNFSYSRTKTTYDGRTLI